MKKIKNWLDEHKDQCAGWAIVIALMTAYCAVYAGLAKAIDWIVDRFDLS